MMPEESFIIHKIFSQVAREFPDRVALQIKKENQWIRFTYKDLDYRFGAWGYRIALLSLISFMVPGLVFLLRIPEKRVLHNTI